ncbi:MAG: sigma-70 family RNA polymerase sigma factor [Ignavibacteriaceae bacterium]|jgi:RNA polymerase sigma-70 factor (ECF subfamily)
MKNLTDIEIIDSVKKGNQSDYALLIEKYKNKAFSLLVRMLKNEMESEEVLQDCFLKAFYSLDSFRQESKFSTWFYRIVYNTALTRISAKKRKIETEMASIDDHLEIKSDYDFREAEQKDASKFIHKLIELLPPKYASVINMYYLDNMSCEEISNVMETSVANIKVMLHRSRSALKDQLIKNNYAEELL